MKAVVRLAVEDEAPQFCEWMTTTKDNLFDPDIAKYPSLRTLAIDVDGSPAVYIPFHPVMVIESLAHRPEITNRENAVALIRGEAVVEKLARMYGMSEIYWMCKDESLIGFAQRYGYEVVDCKVLRKKLVAPEKS
jgi:hypothetical protein